MTTAVLSEWHRTRDPAHWCPYNVHARTMGRSSCNADVERADWAGHGSWSTWVADHAAQPHVPGVSVKMVVVFRENEELLHGRT